MQIRRTLRALTSLLLLLTLVVPLGWLRLGAQELPSTELRQPKRITPQQAKKLFGMVDELSRFAADESGLKQGPAVKRELISRTTVERYLREKFDEDESAKRMAQGELVLKKFGLLDRDFNLKPFLLDLLKEQIEAYYDAKKKTVFLLDWVDIDEQRPVLAHELTHALQDERVKLDKWSDQTPVELSHNASEDSDHLLRDEMDTARDAVAEGQATAVMMDLVLKAHGESVVSSPELVERMQEQMSTSGDSPLMARAPLLLSESLVFPYREGLGFVQDLWVDKGRDAAFAGALDRPPTSSWEVMNPRSYEQRATPPVPVLPDIHPLVDKNYKAYDIGQMGQLDLRILTELLGGDAAAGGLVPAWDGGIYWAGQRKDASAAEQQKTSSLALFYFSQWKSAESAENFAALYADGLGHKYSNVQRDAKAEEQSPAGVVEEIYQTSEGPVVVAMSGRKLFIAESFDLEIAHKLEAELFAAQGEGPTRIAQVEQPTQTLTASLRHFLANCGAMKFASRAVVAAGKHAAD